MRIIKAYKDYRKGMLILTEEHSDEIGISITRIKRYSYTEPPFQQLSKSTELKRSNKTFKFFTMCMRVPEKGCFINYFPIIFIRTSIITMKKQGGLPPLHIDRMVSRITKMLTKEEHRILCQKKK